jgi:hypothetical protein
MMRTRAPAISSALDDALMVVSVRRARNLASTEVSFR